MRWMIPGGAARVSSGSPLPVRVPATFGQAARTAWSPSSDQAFAQDAGPVDLEAVFERAPTRVLDAFASRRSDG